MKTKRLRYFLVTHEFSASCAADGYARATGRPGVLSIIPGPGITNSLTGLGEALLDSVPVVAIVCDVARGCKYRPFQLHELPPIAMLQQVTKGVFEVRQACEIALAVRQDFALAKSGEPGPVAVVIPYPFFIETCHYNVGPVAPDYPFDADACRRALALLGNRGCKVGIYAGLGCMDHAASLVQLAEVLQAPVATSVSGKGAFPEDHPLSVGWGYGPAGRKPAEVAFEGVDLVLAIGVKYSEVSTGFYNIPPHRVIQVDANPKNLGRVVKPEVCVASDSGVFLARALEQADTLRRPPDGKLVCCIKNEKQAEQCEQVKCYPTPCGVDPMALVLALRRCANPDALFYVDVTTAEHYAAEAYTVVRPRTYFNPSNNQAMGWSIPAAIGGQAAYPGRQVLTLTGDGCFLMTALELSTAARECLPVKFFILADGTYKIMQKLQQAAYMRTTATILAHLDYAALAKGFGLHYQEINPGDDLDAAVRGALCHPGPVLTRVAADYGKRPIRWLSAVRSRYMKELTTGQKVRFVARAGTRAINPHKEND